MASRIAAFACLLCLAACERKPSATANVCIPTLGDEGVIRAAREVEVLDQPNGKHMLNPRASEAFRRNVFYEIDPTAAIERICSKDGWTKVRVTNLDFAGWVRDGDVEPVPRDRAGVRVYETKDITFVDGDWSPRERAMKPRVLAKFNEVSRECHDLEPLVMAAPDSTAEAPKFNFTCDDGHPHFIPYEPGE